MPCLVQTLKSQTGGQGTVTDYRYYLFICTARIAGCGHAERGRDRCTRMPDIKTVVITLFAFRKTADTIELSQGMKIVISTGQKLMSIRLMTNIPDNLVLGRIEDPMQSDREFNNAQ